VSKLGPLPILKANMNPDLHMAGDLKNTGKGNLFVVFGEPDIDIEHESDGRIKVRVKGVDVYDPNTGEIRSNDTKGIAACSSTPPTTKRASSSATPISSARTTPTGASRRRCAPISTRRPGPRSTAPSPAPLRGPRRARSR
jgi:hypothetical protein